MVAHSTAVAIQGLPSDLFISADSILELWPFLLATQHATAKAVHESQYS